MTSSRQRQAGFTLLEVLIALSMTALITTAIVGGLHIGQRAWTTSRADEGRGEVEAAAAALAELTSRAYPAVALNDKVAMLVFAGRKNSLAFVTLSEGEAQRGGLLQVEIGLTGPRGHELNVWSNVFRAENAWTLKPADMRIARVFDDATTLDISYFGVAEPQTPAQWREDWLGRDRLPELIAFRLALQRKTRRFDTRFVTKVGAG